MVMMAADYVDDRTMLELLPFIPVDKIDDILAAKDGAEYDRIEDEETEIGEDDADIDAMIAEGLGDDDDNDSDIMSAFDDLESELDSIGG